MDYTQIISAVIALIIALVSAFLIPWLKTKIDADKLQTLRTYVEIGAKAAEQLYTAVSTAISLQTLENSLTVVQAHCRRAEGNVAVRHNYRIVPALSLIIGHYQHMVSEDMTESQLALVLGFFFRTSRQLFFDFHVKNLFFDSFAANRCAVGRL